MIIIFCSFLYENDCTRFAYTKLLCIISERLLLQEYGHKKIQYANYLNIYIYFSIIIGLPIYTLRKYSTAAHLFPFPTNHPHSGGSCPLRSIVRITEPDNLLIPHQPIPTKTNTRKWTKKYAYTVFSFKTISNSS